MQVGVVGLGSMGMVAALQLAAYGHAVTGCEIRPGGGAELEAAGGACVTSADALPDGLDALVLFVVTVWMEVTGQPALGWALGLLAMVLALYGLIRLRRRLPERTATRRK